MAQETDSLIVGGPGVYRNGPESRARRVSLTFAGLADAYEIIPECNAIVIVPNRDIHAMSPTADDITRFEAPGGLHPIIPELGLLEPGSSESIPVQVRRGLTSIPSAGRPLLGRRAATLVFRYVLERTFNVVHSGGTVHLLIPEDLPTWPDDEKAFVRDALPGIAFYTDTTWASRVSGEYAWMLEHEKSNIWFGLADDYQELLAAEGYLGIPDPLPYPDRVLEFLPADVPVSVAPGAIDRAGQRRVMELCWGTGRFVLGPATALPAVLARLGVETGGDTALGATEVPCGSLESMLPADPNELAAWHKAVGWDREDGRHGRIHSFDVLARTLDAIESGARRSSDKVAVDGHPTTDPNGGSTTGDAIRKLLERFQKKPDLPPRLRDFLAAAQVAWEERFRYT